MIELRLDIDTDSLEKADQIIVKMLKALNVEELELVKQCRSSKIHPIEINRNPDTPPGTILPEDKDDELNT